MSKHWSEAQGEEREAGPGNFILTDDESAWMAGSPERGWIVGTHEQCLGAQTADGVEMVLEELGLPSLGWH